MTDEDRQSRQLSPEELGQLGETLFKAACVQARLTPNPVSWDRTGWDVFVQWPHPKSPHVTLDNRDVPISCLVQVKTLWADNSTVRFNLSSIARLAQDLKPAFVYCLRLSADDQTPVAARIIHVRDDFLAMVLKRLRQAQIAGKEPNDVEFSVSIDKWGEELEVGGKAFRVLVETAVAPGMFDHASMKQGQLKELGFKADRYRVNATLVGTEQEIFDAFLGVRPVRAENIRRYETRFDIPVPLASPNGDVAEMTFGVESGEPCTITLRGDQLDPLIKFKADIVDVPKLVSGPNLLVLLVRADLFRLQLKFERHPDRPTTTDVMLTPEDDRMRTEAHTAAGWRDFYRFFVGLADGPLKIEIKPMRNKVIRGDISLSISGGDVSRHWLEMINVLGRAFRRAEAPNTKFRLSDVGKVQRDIFLLQTLFDHPERLRAPVLAFDRELSSENGPPLLLYFRAVRLGTYSLLYCAKMDLLVTPPSDEGEEASWVGGNFEMIGIRRVKEVEGSMDGFVDEMVRSTGVKDRYVSLSELHDVDPDSDEGWSSFAAGRNSVGTSPAAMSAANSGSSSSAKRSSSVGT